MAMRYISLRFGMTKMYLLSVKVLCFMIWTKNLAQRKKNTRGVVLCLVKFRGVVRTLSNI